MNVPGLLEFFNEHRATGNPVALVTVFETQGSTYSKAGAQMLLDRDGHFHGMLSGGCLEGDLALRAAEVISSGTPQVVTYDLAQDDELWGLGVGCDGLMRVLLQSLTADSSHEPFSSIAAALQGTRACRFALVVGSDSGAIEAGAGAIELADDLQVHGIDPGTARELLGDGAADEVIDCEIDGRRVRVLRSTLRPARRVLVLGAGLDAEPVIRLSAELGWRCTVVDHRQAYLERGRFEGAETALCVAAEDLAASVDLSQFDAAIVMSHHLVSDRAYLRQLAATDIGYVGLLGPINRRDRLVSELGPDGARLAGRLHGPAGLDIGGRGPAAIALSIVAQMQSLFEGKSD